MKTMGVDFEQIKLTQEQKERLAKLAEQSGQSWSDVFDQCVQQGVTSLGAETSQDGTGAYIEDPVRWQTWFGQWLNRQRSRNPNVDDSRESIYRDRT